MDRLARIWARLWLWNAHDFRGCGRRCIFLHNLRHDSALELKRVASPTFTLVIWAAHPGKKRGAAASPSAASQQSYGPAQICTAEKRGSQPRGANANHYHLGSRYHSHLERFSFKLPPNALLRQSAKLK